MTQGKSLSALDIAQELNVGKATVKFLLTRFKKWLPHERSNGMLYYRPESIKMIIKILEHLEAGMLPGEIENCLDELSSSDPDPGFYSSFTIPQDEDIHINKEGAVLLKTLFSDLNTQQRRIAIAHEKRAAAEERKAVAIEKRAEAEEKKAEAMNNIANALQEMNRIRGGGFEPVSQKMVHHAAKALMMDEADPISMEMENGFGVSAESFEIQMETPGICLSEDLKIDDLSLLIENEFQDSKGSPDNLDDLSALIETNVQPVEIDDLSALLDKVSSESDTNEDLDDLSRLISLVEVPMDDLSMLIEPVPSPLSLPSEEENLTEIKTINIDVSPDDDIEKYKAAIMKVILELKTNGLSAEEATLLLNKNKIRTLSGKPEWSQKAISQIYKFMSIVK
ncbi:MAG: MerR family transcriptional regulator [Desulfobacteraceae bacterium]|nr:MerR family transcriptional regulator [Desulfobacteraceae bacterium]